jgi:hypothetical protein
MVLHRPVETARLSGQFGWLAGALSLVFRTNGQNKTEQFQAMHVYPRSLRLADRAMTSHKGTTGMAQFEHYIGIDYSGIETPDSSCKGLRVYVASCVILDAKAK